MTDTENKNETAQEEPSMEEILSSIRKIIAEDDNEEGEKKEEATPEAPAAPAEEPVQEEVKAEEAPIEPEPPVQEETPTVTDVEVASEEGDDIFDLTDPIEETAPEEVKAEETPIEPEPVADEQTQPLQEETTPEEVAPAIVEEEPSINASIDQPIEETVEEKLEDHIEENMAPHEEMQHTPPPLQEIEEASQIVETTPHMQENVPNSLMSDTSMTSAGTAFNELHSTVQKISGNMALGQPTLDDILKEVLKPMLKGWLDEHLPGIVEELVRQEIERVVNRAKIS